MTSRLEKNKTSRKKLNKEETKEKSKKWIKVILKIILIIGLIVGISSSIMYFLGNAGLVVKEYSIDYENLPDSFYGIKVIQLSDIHYGNAEGYSKLKIVVDKINDIKPDIVVFTGDLVDSEYKLTSKEKKKIINLLNSINVTVGKYAVNGNHDDKYFNDIIKNTDFKYLDNNIELVYYKGKTPIQIVGYTNDNDDYQLSNYNDELFTLILIHQPDNIKKVLKLYTPALVLAGHSHNGQINVPYVKDLFRIYGAKNYSEPYYRVDNTDLYVSSGIGDSVIPFRLFNHPSINLYRLK